MVVLYRNILYYWHALGVGSVVNAPCDYRLCRLYVPLRLLGVQERPIATLVIRSPQKCACVRRMEQEPNRLFFL